MLLQMRCENLVMLCHYICSDESKPIFQEIQKTIGEVLDAAADNTKAVAGIAAEAPRIVEDNINLVDGLARTVAYTSGFIGGVALHTVSKVAEGLGRDEGKEEKADE